MTFWKNGSFGIWSRAPSAACCVVCSELSAVTAVQREARWLPWLAPQLLGIGSLLGVARNAAFAVRSSSSRL